MDHAITALIVLVDGTIRRDPCSIRNPPLRCFPARRRRSLPVQESIHDVDLGDAELLNDLDCNHQGQGKSPYRSFVATPSLKDSSRVSCVARTGMVMPIGRTEGFPRASSPLGMGSKMIAPSIMAPFIRWDVFISFFEIALPDRLEIERRQPSRSSPRSLAPDGRLRCAFHSQSKIEIRRRKVVQRVVDLIHPIGLSFLPGRVADGDCLQIEQRLPVPAYQEIGMRRDPGNIGMKFDLESTAKEQVVEEQLKNG